MGRFINEDIEKNLIMLDKKLVSVQLVHCMSMMSYARCINPVPVDLVELLNAHLRC